MQPTFLLDVIEWLIEQHGYDSELERTLAMGNSLYTATDDGLEVRVLPKVKEQVQAVVNSAAGSAGDHLATAWAQAYSRTPDSPKAYSEAIKAVEAAAAPVVEPKNAKATLGTILGEIRKDFSRWKVDLSPSDDGVVEDVTRMMGLLWSGQTSRHGGAGPTRKETPEEARVAVHLAATIVQLFVSAAFMKR